MEKLLENLSESSTYFAKVFGMKIFHEKFPINCIV